MRTVMVVMVMPAAMMKATRVVVVVLVVVVVVSVMGRAPKYAEKRPLPGGRGATPRFSTISCTSARRGRRLLGSCRITCRGVWLGWAVKNAQWC